MADKAVVVAAAVAAAAKEQVISVEMGVAVRTVLTDRMAVHQELLEGPLLCNWPRGFGGHGRAAVAIKAQADILKTRMVQIFMLPTRLATAGAVAMAAVPANICMNQWFPRTKWSTRYHTGRIRISTRIHYRRLSSVRSTFPYSRRARFWSTLSGGSGGAGGSAAIASGREDGSTGITRTGRVLRVALITDTLKSAQRFSRLRSSNSL